MRAILLKPGDERVLIDAIRALNAAAVTSEKASALLADPSYVMIVALTDANEVAGRIYGNVLHRHDATDLLLYEVDTREAFQRKGAGRALIECARELCRVRGYSEMWVLTELDNDAGNALYRSAGGRLEGSPANMYVFDAEKT